jgi:hypothetical protein
LESKTKRRTEGSAVDFAGLDVVEDEYVVERVLGAEIITFEDLGVRGTSDSPIATESDEQGITNFSGRK